MKGKLHKETVLAFLKQGFYGLKKACEGKYGCWAEKMPSKLMYGASERILISSYFDYF